MDWNKFIAVFQIYCLSDLDLQTTGRDLHTNKIYSDLMSILCSNLPVYVRRIFFIKCVNITEHESSSILWYCTLLTVELLLTLKICWLLLQFQTVRDVEVTTGRWKQRNIPRRLEYSATSMSDHQNSHIGLFYNAMSRGHVLVTL